MVNNFRGIYCIVQKIAIIKNANFGSIINGCGNRIIEFQEKNQRGTLGKSKIFLPSSNSHTHNLLRPLFVAENRKPAKPSTFRTCLITTSVYNIPNLY